MTIGSSCALVGLAALSACLGMHLAPQDPAAKTAAQERYEAVKEMWSLAGDFPYLDSFKAEEPRLVWSRRLAEAAVECGALVAPDALGQHLARMEKELVAANALFDAARATGFEIAAARYHVADAKLLLARAQSKK